jgi:hypothetical protein
MGFWNENPVLELVWPLFIAVPVGLVYFYKKAKNDKGKSKVFVSFLPYVPPLYAGVLDPQKWLTFPLVEKKNISPNTALYRFELPNPDNKLGLPIGQVNITGQQV